MSEERRLNVRHAERKGNTFEFAPWFHDAYTRTSSRLKRSLPLLYGGGGVGQDASVRNCRSSHSAPCCRFDGAQGNLSSVVYKGQNFVQFSANLNFALQGGPPPTQTDPLLGALSIYRASPGLAADFE